jgi:hypothetical protein
MSLPQALRTPSATVALGVVVLLLVGLGGWMLLVGPAAGALGTAQAELSDARDSTDMLRVKLRRLQQQADELGPVTQQADELATLFPATADQPGFFALMADATRQAGISPRNVTTLSPTAPVPWTPGATPAASGATGASGAGGTTAGSAGTVTDLAVQQVEVSVEADYDQARRLLEQLERMDRSFLLQSVTVTADEGGGSFLVSATGSTFVAAPLVAPTDVPGQPADQPADQPAGQAGAGAARAPVSQVPQERP